MATALRQAGFRTLTPASPSEWLDAPERRTVVLCIDGDQTFALLRMLVAKRSDTLVVAVVPVASYTACRHSLHMGVAAVVAQDATLEQLVAAVRSALQGYTLLPTSVVQSWAAELTGELTASETEIGWLQALAAGTTVSRLAHDSGYSERALYRRLAELYGRIGVTNRMEALMWGRRQGLID